MTSSGCIPYSQVVSNGLGLQYTYWIGRPTSCGCIRQKRLKREYPSEENEFHFWISSPECELFSGCEPSNNQTQWPRNLHPTGTAPDSDVIHVGMARKTFEVNLCLDSQHSHAWLIGCLAKEQSDCGIKGNIWLLQLHGIQPLGCNCLLLWYSSAICLIQQFCLKIHNCACLKQF